MTDESLMPYGKYQNWKLINVPAEYLMYMYNEQKLNSDLIEYVEDNMDVLKMEIKNNKYAKTEDYVSTNE